MTDWIDAAREGSLAPGEHLLVEIDGDALALFHIDGEYFAIQDVCSHDGTEIASGQLEGCEIICPRHGARFCLKTGKVLSPPAYEDIATYPVRIRVGRIEIGTEPLH
jgi:3-phenylpropionate/trans-cinnamate dioxygenase ferredoxin subunit